METTYVMVKPDGVQRGLIGEIIGRFEQKGLKLVGLKAMVPSEETARTHYAVHAERPFFPGLIKFVTSGPVVCMAWAGRDAISVARNLIGPTNGREAAPGTIRGDYGMDIGYNMIHGSMRQKLLSLNSIFGSLKELCNGTKPSQDGFMSDY